MKTDKASSAGAQSDGPTQHRIVGALDDRRFDRGVGHDASGGQIATRPHNEGLRIAHHDAGRWQSELFRCAERGCEVGGLFAENTAEAVVLNKSRRSVVGA